MLSRKFHMLLLGLVIGVAVPLSGQIVVAVRGNWADSSARMIVSQFRERPVNITPILRQAEKPQSRAKLDEIADSLAVMGTVMASMDSYGPSNWGLVIHALTEAGRSVSKESGGLAYPRALDKLIAMDRATPRNSLSRNQLLQSILVMPQHDQALRYLRTVVTSDDPFAREAISAMISEIDSSTIRYREASAEERAATTALLRDLFRKVQAEPSPVVMTGKVPMLASNRGTATIPNPDAALFLTAFARRAGWDK